MTDRNMQDFQGRLGRIDQIHRSGGGFEAEGTIGQSHYTAQRRRRFLPRWPFTLLSLLLVLVAIKASLITVVGPNSYEERLDTLRRGNLAEQIGARLLATDPVSNALAAQLIPYANRLR